MAKRFAKTESHKVKQGIFVLFAFLVAISLYLLFTQESPVLGQVLFAVAILSILMFMVRYYDFLLTLKEFERAVIFRFGKVNRVGGPGWALMFPILESFSLVDLRTQTIDVKPQEVITKDRVVVEIDAIIYLYVNKDAQSVINSVVEIDDYRKGAEQFVIATIRDSAGELNLNELISSVEKLNQEVKQKVQQITATWGVSIEAVEIQHLALPHQLEEALAEQKAAEQKKLARFESAAAHQAEIDAVRNAAEQLSDKALAYYYIRALEKLGESPSTKFVFPMELSKLAEAVGGHMGNRQTSNMDDLFRRYAPALKAIVGKELDEREKKKKKNGNH